MSSYEHYKHSGRTLGALLHHLDELGVPLRIVEEVRSGPEGITCHGSPFAKVTWDDKDVPTFEFTGYGAAAYTRMQDVARRRTKSFNQYRWLELYLPQFLEDCGVLGGWPANAGIIGAHGDKFYQYRSQFANARLHFGHGCAIGMLTYCHPYSTECRETSSGWVAPVDWIVQNKERFLGKLPVVDETDTRYMR